MGEKYPDFSVILHDAGRQQWLSFQNPIETVTAHAIEEVVPALEHIEQQAAAHSLYAAGFLSYEAAPAFDSVFKVHSSPDFPLLVFGLYEKPLAARTPEALLKRESYQLGAWKPSVNRDSYAKAIRAIKDAIARGDTYQVNFTYPLQTNFTGDPATLFLELTEAQLASYAAFVDLGDLVICSVSPELFFSLEKGILSARPMKGTTSRGLTLEQDEAQATWLRSSEKNRAENVMIVDMLRNDIGRVAELGTVRVPRLFTVERYPTLWQMTSTVRGKTTMGLTKILSALFPCASITGAPKISTMRIINELETFPRKIYTGSIGFLTPENRAQFNVAIRTVLINRKKQTAEYGVGGGIVWDSDTDDEFAESRLKAKVLTHRQPEFDLLETMLWEPEDSYFLFPYHLNRLRKSAAYFRYRLDTTRVWKMLEELEYTLPPKPHRIRVLVSRQGEIKTEAVVQKTKNLGQFRVALAAQPIDPTSPFLYHKTTHREIYDRARKNRSNFDDVLLWNTRGELSEFTIGNLIVQIDDEYFTPPVESGLLPGTYRAWLLDQGKIKEEVLTRDALAKAKNIFMINSVQKWRKAIGDW